MCRALVVKLIICSLLSAPRWLLPDWSHQPDDTRLFHSILTEYQLIRHEPEILALSRNIVIYK